MLDLVWYFLTYSPSTSSRDLRSTGDLSPGILCASVNTPSWAWRFEFVALGAVTNSKGGDRNASEGVLGVQSSNTANENAHTENRPVLFPFLTAPEAAKRAAFKGCRDQSSKRVGTP